VAYLPLSHLGRGPPLVFQPYFKSLLLAAGRTFDVPSLNNPISLAIYYYYLLLFIVTVVMLHIVSMFEICHLVIYMTYSRKYTLT